MEFKVGDKVVIESGVLKGKIGTVKYIEKDNKDNPLSYAIEFDDHFEGAHNCRGFCKYDKGRWHSFYELSLFSQNENNEDNEEKVVKSSTIKQLKRHNFIPTRKQEDKLVTVKPKVKEENMVKPETKKKTNFDKVLEELTIENFAELYEKYPKFMFSYLKINCEDKSKGYCKSRTCAKCYREKLLEEYKEEEI
jgi:hypothetical protein